MGQRCKREKGMGKWMDKEALPGNGNTGARREREERGLRHVG
jgi:hypothetical protein